jgi:hypothetical protein
MLELSRTPDLVADGQPVRSEVLEWLCHNTTTKTRCSGFMVPEATLWLFRVAKVAPPGRGRSEEE